MALQYVPAPFGRGGSGQRTAELMRALAANNFQRSSIGRQETMGLSDMQRKFSDIRRRIPGSFNQRGMLDSGQRNRAWRRNFADEMSDVNRLKMGFDSQRNQLNLGDFAAEGAYATGGLQSVMGDAAGRAAKAAQIRGAAI